MNPPTDLLPKAKSALARKTFAVILGVLGGVLILGVISTIPTEAVNDPAGTVSGTVFGLALLVGGIMLYRSPRKQFVMQQPAEDRSGLPPIPPPPPLGRPPFNRLAVWSFILSLYPIATPYVPIILGFVARSQIKERATYGRVERGGRLAVSAIVAGFVWTALFVLWVVLLSMGM